MENTTFDEKCEYIKKYFFNKGITFNIYDGDEPEKFARHIPEIDVLKIFIHTVILTDELINLLPLEVLIYIFKADDTMDGYKESNRIYLQFFLEFHKDFKYYNDIYNIRVGRFTKCAKN